jgi:hypothetical protein
VNEGKRGGESEREIGEQSKKERWEKMRQRERERERERERRCECLKRTLSRSFMDGHLTLPQLSLSLSYFSALKK